MCLRWSIIDEKNHSAIASKELKNKMQLIVIYFFEVDPYNVIRRAVRGAIGKHLNSLLNRALSWPIHSFYLNKFHREDLLKQEDIKEKERKKQ